MELEIENTEVIGSNNIQIEIPNAVEISEGKKDYEVRAVKKEYTIIGDNIFIPSMYEDAPLWLKEFIDTTIEVAVINRDQSLIDRMEAILTAMDYVPKNQYTEQINQIVGEDGIINSRIATLNSNLTDAISSINATIANINATYVSREEAAAIVSNALTATFGSDGQIGSVLIELQETYAELESTTAQSISMLESVMEGEITGNASAMETIRTYVGIDENGNNTGVGLLTDVTNLSTELSNGTNTWADADSTLENSLRTEITDEGARVESKFAYDSTLMLNGTSYSSGFGIATSLTSGSGLPTGQSEFWIKADKFKLMSADGGKKSSYSPFTVDSVTGEINFNGKVTFSNVTGTQGSGTNLLYNSAPKIGNETKGWSIGWSNHGLSSSIGAGFGSWKPTGGASVYIVVPGNPGIGTVFDINNSRFPVIANTRYEASAYLSSHRCNSQVALAWFDGNGNYISESRGTLNSNASGGSLAGWSRSTMLATAPSNAATVLFYVRSVVTNNDPQCFVAYAYAGIASANQTIPSNWSEGSSAGVSSGDVVTEINNGSTTTIDGGRITTGSITANQIAANTITSDKISTYNLTASNATIQNGLITNAEIADLSVGTLKIQDEAVIAPRSAEGSGSTTIVYTTGETPMKLLIFADSSYGGGVGASSMVLYVNGVAIDSWSTGNSYYGGKVSFMKIVSAAAYTTYTITFTSYYKNDVPRGVSLSMLGAKK